MKFKTIFYLFNVVVLFAFLFILFMPMIMLGSEYSQLFWSQNWYLVLFFVLFIIALDLYFVFNWKLFLFLEAENWPGLMAYLEEKIYQKNQFRTRYLNLYINTSLSVSNLEKISRLEVELREKKAELLPNFAFLLGIPHLLDKNYTASEDYYRSILDLPKLKEEKWIIWCFAFTLFSQKKLEEAAEQLSKIPSDENRDLILQLVSLYLLDTVKEAVTINEPKKIAELSVTLKNKILVSTDGWNKIMEKGKQKNILIVLLSALIEDAKNWLDKIQ